MLFIQKTLKNKLITIGLEKKEIKSFRQWKKKKNLKRSHAPATVPLIKPDAQVKDPPKNGWTNVAARRQLAIGINEVTKALERNELKLVLVCMSVRPKHMTHHLITLSATRGVPACQVPQLSQSVSELLRLKSVLALGFRHCASKDDDVFSDSVNAIMPRVPSLDVAWLLGAASSATPEQLLVTKEEKDSSDKRGQKRTYEGEPKEVTESVSSCTLQPLKVKKIVANPLKKRARKKEKVK
ncbi:hypothetical protein LDENG_00147090 [Lucifuga dentata]|nr:hypothetical protein LDENG_00147090 [Lucifuga dentata]